MAFAISGKQKIFDANAPDPDDTLGSDRIEQDAPQNGTHAHTTYAFPDSFVGTSSRYQLHEEYDYIAMRTTLDDILSELRHQNDVDADRDVPLRREVEVVRATGTECHALDGKQAADGLKNDVSFGISVKEMEEVEKCLKMEQEKMKFGYPKANESLREYLWRCHKRNFDMLLCPRCSIRICRRVAEDYERWQRTKTERNWRKESQLQKVCGAVYNRELAEAFERIPYNQGWDRHGGNSNMYNFNKRGEPRRPDSPHPRAKRIMVKLPAEVPEDKWTQAGPKKGKWRSFEDGGRTS
ncbi:hypothetical protein KIW84_030342 [Lathyrus oleraceus]|uniref:Uncharacterized protein n=1 Tax=Pisum sativum TaxID=3888 RepID=A0A9D5AZA4_PEA|nr:hypothetical protein KIW84_030342 [Pisum sativum]